MPIPISLATALYHAGIRMAVPFLPKARAWVEGRKTMWNRLGERAAELDGCLWMHCASVGEFEQGRPVLEAIKRERPDIPVLLTFFSPSGYEARKGHALATHVEYLPPDGTANAARLQRLVRPRAALFIKYEFWHAHLHALKAAGVPTFLVSAIFRPSQPFFQWYGRAHRSMLACFDHLFVQDEASRDLLAGIGIHHVTVSGDTRFDRVSAVVEQDEVLARAQAFRTAAATLVLVAGSTWPADEDLLAEGLAAHPGLRSILAPHELDDRHLQATVHRFPGPVARWGEEDRSAGVRTLLMDRMGYLSRLYKYGDMTYVGGGFGSGIHNTLEPAAWGRPVIFGPHHARFAEARGLIDAGAGFCVRNGGELSAVLGRLMADTEARHRAAEAARRYVHERTGATARVVNAVLPAL